MKFLIATSAAQAEVLAIEFEGLGSDWKVFSFTEPSHGSCDFMMVMHTVETIYGNERMLQHFRETWLVRLLPEATIQFLGSEIESATTFSELYKDYGQPDNGEEE